MSLIGSSARVHLDGVLVLLLLARMVLDRARVMADSLRWMSRARALTHAGTKPVIAPVRRVLRPVRASGLSIDLAFTAVFVVSALIKFPRSEGLSLT